VSPPPLLDLWLLKELSRLPAEVMVDRLDPVLRILPPSRGLGEHRMKPKRLLR
jgi:hypothetical protein